MNNYLLAIDSHECIIAHNLLYFFIHLIFSFNWKITTFAVKISQTYFSTPKTTILPIIDDGE